jgi:hypothetical protein
MVLTDLISQILPHCPKDQTHSKLIACGFLLCKTTSAEPSAIDDALSVDERSPFFN